MNKVQLEFQVLNNKLENFLKDYQNLAMSN